jgi:uncharacterized protein (DUF1778 family)
MPSNATARAVRGERLEARVTRAHKELFAEAASVQGRSLTAFMVAALEEQARRILQEQETIALSARDRAMFVQALLSPPTPRGRLARAVRRYGRTSADS